MQKDTKQPAVMYKIRERSELIQLIGGHIRRIRSTRGMCVHALAISAEVPLPSLIALENGTLPDIDIRTLNSIAAGLEVEIADLFVE
jgi:DNA-binding Xre family transcriptional regulator